MNKVMIGAVLALVAVVMSGCVSGYVAYNTQQEHIKSALIMRATPNGAPMVGIDLTAFTDALLNAYKAHPYKMLGANILDLGTMYGAYAIGTHNAGNSIGQSGSGGSVSSSTPTTSTGSVIVNGNYNTVSFGDSHDENGK